MAANRVRPTSDKGVMRRYTEAAPNKLFSEAERGCIRFVTYQTSVPCTLCGKLSKHHWTCVVRFKPINMDGQSFVLKEPRRWTPAGAPVCRDHPMRPDVKLFLRKVRAAQLAAKQTKETAHAK